MLTEEMKRVVGEQRLGFVATVCPDGTPNLSTKGTTAVWDDEHLVFADICSPGTVNNLRRNSSVEINCVDQISRKGFRFKGQAQILKGGELFDEIVAFYRQKGITNSIRHIVLIKVVRALPVVSPIYDSGLTEEEVRRKWQKYWQSLGEQSTVENSNE